MAGSTRWRSFLDVLTNLVIIVVLSYGAYLMWGVRKTRGAGDLLGTPNLKQLGAEIVSSPSRRTVIVAVSPNCAACREDVPFFRQLLEASQKSHRFDLVFAVPERPPDAAEFFESSAPGAEIRTVSFNRFAIRRIPIIAILETTGAISNIWTGAVGGDREQEILGSLLGAPSR